MRVVPLFLLALCAALPATAQIEGIGYRLTAAGNYVDFEGDAALTDGLLYGGGLGFAFGEFVELGGTYQLGQFDTDFSGLADVDGTPATVLAGLPTRRVDVQRYGGALKLNLAPTFVVPFVTAGTGIVRLAPDGLDATRSIYLLGGAGVQVTARDRYAFSLAVEDFAYRYNVGSALLGDDDLATVGLAREQFEERTVHNLGLRAAANVYLGGRRPGQLTDLDRAFQRQFSGGLSGLSVVVEPYYARVSFDDALPFRDHAFVGAEAGFDFGPLVGVRGYYGRAVDTADPTDLENIQLYGGDLRLRLSEGRGLVPFLTVGGGYLDVLTGYAADDDAEDPNTFAEDRPFAAAGAGVAILVTPRLRALGEVRGLLMSAQSVESVSQTADVFFSPMYRVGVSFGVGGRSGGRVEAVRQSTLDAERAAMDAERAALTAQRDSIQAEIAELSAIRDAERAAAARREARLLADLDARLDSARTAGDSTAVARLSAEQAALRARLQAAARADSLAATPPAAAPPPEPEHMVTIPLPREGELYVRYGPPGGVVIEAGPDDVAPGLSEADLRAAIRASLADVLAERDPQAAPLSNADLAALEDRLVERVTARFEPAPSPDAPVTMADLERMERRLETRLLRSIREALGLVPATEGE